MERKVDTKADKTSEKSPEKINNKENFYYHSGAKALLSLSGIEFKNNTDKNQLLDKNKIKNEKYSKFINLDNTEKENIISEDNDKNHKETLNKIQEGLKNKKIETLMNYYLKYDILKNIIFSNGTINKNLKNIFGGKDRLNEILKISEKNIGKKDWWKNELSIKEISIIYSFSFNFLKIPVMKGIDKVKNTITGIFNINNVDSKNNIEYNFLSKNIINFFRTKYGIGFGSKNILSKNEKLKNDFSKYLDNLKLNNNDKNIEIEKLNKLIKFKDNLLDNDFLNNKKIGFSELEKIKFKDNLNYKWIFGLFGLLNGDTNNIKFLSPLNSLSLAYFNSEIIGNGKGNEFEGKKYLSKYMYKAFLTDSIFTKEEQEVIQIYFYKFINFIFAGYADKIGGLLGIISGPLGIDMKELSLISGGAGFGSRYLGKILTKKGKQIALKTGKTGLETAGKFAKKLGVLGYILSITSGLYYFSNNETEKLNLLKGIREALEKGDTKKVIQQLKYSEKLIKQSIKKFEIENNNGKIEELKVLQKKDSKPRIFYKGNEYSINIIDKSTDIRNGNYGGFLKNLILSSLNKNKNGKYSINGKIINFEKVEIKGENIIFGEDDKIITFKITDLFKNLNNKKTKTIAKNQWESIKNLIEDMSEEYDSYFGKGENVEYKEIKNLGNNKFLVLVKI